jgi:acetyl-CoA carboxylase beta subunit
MSPYCYKIIERDDINLILIDCDDISERLDRNITRDRERGEFFRTRPDDGSEESDVETDVDVKKCPYCRYMVYKEDGCDAVKCPNCKHKFCFNCLEMYKFMESTADHQKKCDNFNNFDSE